MSHALSTLFICSHKQHQEHLEQWITTHGKSHSWSAATVYENAADAALTIEQVRDLQTTFAYSPLTRSDELEVHCILHVENSSIPAQNALLKLVEEPPQARALVLSASDSNSVIPTLLSRCRTELCKQSNDVTANLEPLIERLLSQPNIVTYSEIIEFCSTFADREAGLAFAQETITYMHQNLYKDIAMIQKNTQALQAFALVKNDLTANVNVKLAFETCLFTLKQG